MNDAERIELFRSYCQFSYYPPALTEAACDYLAGQGSLEQVRQYARPDLPNIFTIKPSLLNAWQFGKHAPISQGSLLDALDCRLLDICEATNRIWECLTEVGDAFAVQEALEYLMTQGMSPQTLLQGVTGTTHLLTGLQGQPTPFAQALLNTIPARLNDLLNLFSSGSAYQPGKPPTSAAKMALLLLSSEPPAIEQAWGIVEELASKAEPAYVSELGQCARLLLKADPERFTTWIRQIVAQDSPASFESRKLALLALLEYDCAQHVDLAASVTRSELPAYDWRGYQLRRAALDAAYHFDPVEYLPLVGEAALSQNPWLAEHALQLLIAAPAEQARPHLQR
ncbi:MAG TPA: hypothetical protein VH590_04335, partial [Ktedonobacterales bacterium]